MPYQSTPHLYCGLRHPALASVVKQHFVPVLACLHEGECHPLEHCRENGPLAACLAVMVNVSAATVLMQASSSTTARVVRTVGWSIRLFPSYDGLYSAPQAEG